MLLGIVACHSYGADDSGTSGGITPDGGAIDVAIYVSPDGRDFAEGTKSAPVATFKRALDIATSKNAADAVVYPCVASYSENVVLDRTVHVVGNLSCATWTATSERAQIAPPTGVALTIAAPSVVIEDLDVASTADHTRAGDSAIGVFVVRAAGVVLRRMKIEASNAIGGEDGDVQENYAAGPAASGGAANGNTKILGASCTCIDATSSRGGDGGGLDGSQPTSGSAMPAVGGDDKGMSGTLCTEGSGGASGQQGRDGDPAKTPLSVDESGVRPTSGGEATNGTPGQGGGGGGSATNMNTVGASGGCGGCGGGRGTPAKSGGSSIAVLSYSSEVLVDACDLVSAKAGFGGNGGDGEEGQMGGAGGGSGSAGGCVGGGGGAGGLGGNAGSGAGGHSAGIAYVGVAPRVQATTITTGRAGDGGASKQAAPSGKQMDTLEL